MTGLYKIGFSGNLRKRLRQIETASGSKVQLISSVAGDEKLESQLHRLFEDSRQVGEWFDPTPEILTEFKRLEKLAASKAFFLEGQWH
jgi:hypothetical protein